MNDNGYLTVRRRVYKRGNLSDTSRCRLHFSVFKYQALYGIGCSLSSWSTDCLSLWSPKLVTFITKSRRLILNWFNSEVLPRDLPLGIEESPVKSVDNTEPKFELSISRVERLGASQHTVITSWRS